MQDPQSLVMRACTCFYCGFPAFTHIQVSHMFGIIACDAHVPSAQRDCDAHLHRANQVRLTDAIAHPVLRLFFDALPATFSIRRTSGLIDAGWSIPKDVFAEDCFLRRNSTGAWSLPVQKGPAPEERIGRTVTLASFLDPEVALPSVRPDLIALMVWTLDCGVYKASADAQAGLAAAAAVPEGAGIRSVVVNDVLCRVFEHDGSVAAWS